MLLCRMIKADMIAHHMARHKTCMKGLPATAVPFTSVRTSPACMRPDRNASPSLNT